MRERQRRERERERERERAAGLKRIWHENYTPGPSSC